MSLTPYLFFNGNCREALGFYQKALGGELELMTYGDASKSSPEESCPVGAENRIIHGAIKHGKFMLMASDTPTPDEPPKPGSTVFLALDCESQSQVESYFKALSQGGEVMMELHDAFWGARFGMLTDRYGFSWMLSYDKNKK